eukprot:11123245-Lingulodinium_polyedra.AAC.1
MATRSNPGARAVGEDDGTVAADDDADDTDNGDVMRQDAEAGDGHDECADNDKRRGWRLWWQR